MIKWLRRLSAEKVIRVACYLAIVGMLFMAWSVAWPSALPLVIGLSVGEALGAIALLMFVIATVIWPYRPELEPLSRPGVLAPKDTGDDDDDAEEDTA